MHALRLPGHRTLGLAVLFVLVSLVVLRPTPAQLTGSLPSDLGDPALIAWLLAWASHAVLHHPTGYLQAPMFWPNPDTLVYTDSLLPLAVVFGPVSWLSGSNWALALNVTLLVVLVADQAAVFALVRRLTGSAAAGLVAAVGFVSGAFMLGHRGNPQLLAVFFVPLALLLLLRVLDRPRWRDGLGLGAVLAGCVLTAAYYGVVLAVCAVVVVLAWFLTGPRRLPWAQARVLGAAALLAVVLLAPVLPAYLSLQQDPAFQRGVLPGFGLRPGDLLTPTEGSYVHGFLAAHTTGGHEHELLPGLLVLLLAMVGTAALARTAVARGRPRNLRVREALLVLTAGAVAAVLALGPQAGGVRLPFAFFAAHVPGFSGIRAPVRLVVPGLLAVVVLAGVGWQALVGRARPRVRAGLTAVVCALVLLEMAVAPLWAPLPRDAVTLAPYRLLADLPAGAVVELPIVDPAAGLALAPIEAPRALYARLDDHPRVNGYSGYVPPGYVEDTRLLAQFPAPAALQRLRELRVRYVLLHRGAGDGLGQYGPASADRVLAALPPGVRVLGAGRDLVVDLGAPAVSP